MAVAPLPDSASGLHQERPMQSGQGIDKRKISMQKHAGGRPGELD